MPPTTMTTTTRPLTVLLADDVKMELEIHRTFLQRSGFRVIPAEDGPTALALAQKEAPDLVVLDQVMPGLLGTDVALRLRTNAATSSIPIIITSAHDTPQVREACSKLTAVTFIAKTGTGRESLLQQVAKILRVPERKSIRLTVFFSVVGSVGAGARETLGKGGDIAENGMRLETNRRYEIGSVIRARFILPGDKAEVHVEGRIVRLTPRGSSYELGIQFLQVPEEDRARLNAYLDRTLIARR